MGSGSFDPGAYRAYTNSTVGKSVDEVYTSRTIDPSLDPKGVVRRESRDSPDSPEATPIIVALDVTGSMGFIADQIARQGLGTLFEGILQRKPVTNPHLMFMGIGDAYCDQAPLQVSQFEADNRIVDQLTKLWLEKGGGGNDHESYDFPWYFAGRHTVHDAMEKRGRRGYLFTVGDEQRPEVLRASELERVLGRASGPDVVSATSLAEARRLYDVFHVVIEEGDYASRHLDQVRRSWREALGQRAITLSDHRALAETIVAAIQVAEGADHRVAASGWGTAAGAIVGNAISALPKGAPPPRRLGR